MIRVPRLLPGCDLKSLPLTPVEAYLLSRVDAVMSERDLAMLTGAPVTEVAATLDRLHELGAIDFDIEGEVRAGGPRRAGGTSPEARGARTTPARGAQPRFAGTPAEPKRAPSGALESQ